MPNVIAVAVVEHEGRFLAGPRPAGKALAGLWEFPGGKVKAGERPAGAATRECQEESGLVVQVRGEYPTQTQAYAHGEVELHFFDCAPIGPPQTPKAPFEWVDRARLSHLEFPEGNKELLKLLAAKK